MWQPTSSEIGRQTVSDLSRLPAAAKVMSPQLLRVRLTTSVMRAIKMVWESAWSSVDASTHYAWVGSSGCAATARVRAAAGQVDSWRRAVWVPTWSGRMSSDTMACERKQWNWLSERIYGSLWKLTFITQVHITAAQNTPQIKLMRSHTSPTNGKCVLAWNSS